MNRKLLTVYGHFLLQTGTSGLTVQYLLEQLFKADYIGFVILLPFISILKPTQSDVINHNKSQMQECPVLVAEVNYNWNAYFDENNITIH
jgi:hypothetical protein